MALVETYDTQVPISTTIDSALQGTILERPANHGVLRIYAVEEATAAGKLQHTLFINGDRRLNKRRARRTDDLAVDVQKDLIWIGKIAAGSLIQAQIAEVLGVAMDLDVVYEYTEVPNIQQLKAMMLTN